MTGLLVIMGSGETAPTMIKPHRAIFDRVGDRAAVVLDTPYGFQSNADDISAKAVRYFADSVGREVQVVSWRRPPETDLARERALATLRDAGWIFAGPGSPTYTLRQWQPGPIPQVLADTLTGGGVVCFASAAALTLGSHAVPVYEVYKAGIDPHWVPGLDLVAQVTGLPVVVIPHYDNAEGGHHDTRYCYLGEGRLSTMEAELPPDSFILGIDEHTGVLLDLAAGSVSVVGNGRMTLRWHGRVSVYPSGTVLDLAGLGDLARSRGEAVAAPATASTAGAAEPSTSVARPGAEPALTSLRAAADLIDARFSTALAERDVDGCVTAILELEQILIDWSTDTLTSDDGEHARGLLRGMVVRFGALAEAGARDPRTVVGPFVTALLDVRARARADRDWPTSDRIRERLAEAGVEVRDTADGVEWELR